MEDTVSKLFGALEQRRIRYAVLRNYELFPALQFANDSSPHTDIDLVVDSRDLARMRALVTEIAEQDCWDVLTECDHWAQSKIRHHNIEVFRFCRTDPLEYLQVDVFHGVLVLGLPLADEQNMLEGRIYDSERGLTRIDPVKENIHRMLQIHGLFPGSRRKRKRYREKLLTFRASHRERFDRAVEASLSTFGLRALEALERNDTHTFRRYMSLARTRFAVGFALRNAGSVPSYLYNRLKENIQRYYTRQCGAVIRTAVRDESQRQLLRGIMDELVKNSFMDEWREHEAGQRLTISDHVEMEQGAIIVEWSAKEGADLDLSTINERGDAVKRVLNVCTRSHKQLYLRPLAQESIAVAEVAAS